MMEKAAQTIPDDSLDRIDGRQKVTGTATYSAEYHFAGLVHAVLIESTIAKGRIQNIDITEASKAPGVLAVISHLNAPAIPGYPSKKSAPERMPVGTSFRLFYEDFVYFNGQPVAMVVADTFEGARHAATLVRVTYQAENHTTDAEAALTNAIVPLSVQRSKNSPFQDYQRGNPDAATPGDTRIEATYITPTQHHQPLEPHAIVAVWEAEDKLVVYDKNQGVKSAQGNLAQTFKLPRENVRVIAPFIGGAFGSGIRVWPHTVAAVLAAKIVGKPVKLVLGREQMFTSVGYRPFTIQKIGLAADKNGKLTSISHEATGQTSSYEEHLERTISGTRVMYSCPNVLTRYRLLPLDVNTPTWMRGPGDATGMFALESAMDELAHALQMDPLEFRLRNYAEKDEERNLPWSAKALRTCYETGAEKFGWKSRPKTPGSRREGGWLVGYGMASSLYGFHRHSSKARATLLADGSIVVQSATMDIGPGTGTAMTRIVSKTLGIRPAKIRFDLGDSALPDAPGQNGSSTIPSVGSAVHAVCTDIRKELIRLAVAVPGFRAGSEEDIIFKNGKIYPSASAPDGILLGEILKYHKLTKLDLTAESKSGAERDRYSMYSFGCHFVEVKVNVLTGETRVSRVVTCADVGEIINEKTARSQSIGGIVGGIGMALMEDSAMDHRFGRYVTSDFASYHIPVHADVPDIEVFFTNEPDLKADPIGSKGLGEIAIVGVAAAIANAVFNATGKRVRRLPITAEKLLEC